MHRRARDLGPLALKAFPVLALLFTVSLAVATGADAQAQYPINPSTTAVTTTTATTVAATTVAATTAGPTTAGPTSGAVGAASVVATTAGSTAPGTTAPASTAPTTVAITTASTTGATGTTTPRAGVGGAAVTSPSTASTTPPSTEAGTTTVSVNISGFRAGETVTITVLGFAFTNTADAQGRVVTTITIPLAASDFPDGTTAIVESPTKTFKLQVKGLEIVGSPSSGVGPVFTGTNAVSKVTIAGVLVAVGAFLLLFTRRRRARQNPARSPHGAASA